MSADAQPLFEESGRAIAPTAAIRPAAVRAQLFGLISFEAFGRFDRTIDARDDVFDQAALDLAHQAGLRPTGTVSAAGAAGRVAGPAIPYGHPRDTRDGRSTSALSSHVHSAE
ncbi:hypothetical protein AB0N06_13330 [Streptomyces sp. NPDC051020]|uniref:hypothetical protein n=1 Tax=Streptomyces sp. NPDC051020 TaxID=3155409 RepID=UPI003414D9E6